MVKPDQVNRARLPLTREKGTWRQRVLASLLASLVLAGYANAQPARTTSAEPLASVRSIEETAHLELIDKSGDHVYVYRGPLTGTFDMTVTLTFYDAKHGRFKSVAPDGTLSGEVEITSAAQVERHGQTVVTFDATGDVGRGTLGYRGYYARDLEIAGTVKSARVIDMTVKGRLHRASRRRR
jgi:hypothetical protein